MRWPDLVDAQLTALEADAALTTELGGLHIYAAVSGRVARIPSVEWELVNDPLDETTEDPLVQYSVFARGRTQAVAIMRRIRAVLHRDRGAVISGVAMWSEYVDTREIDFPSEEGVEHWQMDFRLSTDREEAQA